MSAHLRISLAQDDCLLRQLDQSPWQRGSHENTNGLLRQYLPQAADLSGYSQAQLDAIAQRLNTRPRVTLGYRTPAAKLAESVATRG
jgi:IS30 family transposase